MTLLVGGISANATKPSQPTKIVKAELVHLRLHSVSHGSQRRHLRNDNVGRNGFLRDAQERKLAGETTALETLIPSSNDEARTFVKAPQTLKEVANGKWSASSIWAKVKKFFETAKENTVTFMKNEAQLIRFTVWLLNKRTPKEMYYTMKIYETSGYGDKAYRTYIEYVRFYEHFRGPAENPLLTFGPKVEFP
ncbi:unnamed protein product [Phytophthora lilii]|uniref:Unnamed protein product n=1 Tax=Phytophthora lilii TaxID=2077276 RepID=A0A9W6U2K6_9STRA|nr:unnamed protein product [Phytophthora lilii]